MRTAICIPTMGSVKSEFLASILHMKMAGEINLYIENNTLIHWARNRMADYAIEAECDRLLFLDSDMQFEPDLFQRLTQRMEEGCDIITGLCFTRAEPIVPAIFKFDDDGKLVNMLDYPRDSLIEVDACGMAACMIKTDVLKSVKEEFGAPFNPAALSEDIAFCIRAKAQGAKIWCDTSVKLGHVGTMVYDEAEFERRQNDERRRFKENT